MFTREWHGRADVCLVSLTSFIPSFATRAIRSRQLWRRGEEKHCLVVPPTYGYPASYSSAMTLRTRSGLSQMSASVAERMRGDDVRGRVITTVALRDKMFGRGLEVAGTTYGKVVAGCEALKIVNPHRYVAVVAETTLLLEGGTTGGSIAVSHGSVLEAKGKFPVAWEAGRAGTWSPSGYAGTTPGL